MKLKRMIALLCCVSMMMPHTVVDVHAEEIQNVDSAQTLETDEEDEIMMTESENESETETILETEIVSETVIGNETTETVVMEDYVEEESLLSDENSIIAEGTCGLDATWELNEDGLLTITGSGEIECGWADYKDQIKNVIIQEGVNSIATHAFAGCTSLQSIEIPEGVTRIDIAAFYGCQNLKQVTLPSTLTEICSASFNECPIENLVLPDNLQKISDHAFNGLCTKVLVIPESVYYISDYAFSNSKIESVIFEGKETTLGTGVFSNSIYLKDVKLPVNLNEISPNLFEGCVALKNIVIPNTVTSICGAAFVNTNIHTLNIPKSVTMLSIYAFSNMQKLNCLIFEGNAPEVSPNGQYFDQISNAITIGIPKDAKGYNVEPWTNYNVVFIKNISEVSVSEIDDVEYTGEALKPEVTLSDGSYILVENKDYTIEYKNNLEVGTAEIIIKGIGWYEGSVTIHFNIIEAEKFIAQGNCGESATWTLDENGLLTITGFGEIERGWPVEYREQIYKVVIEDGITSIGYDTFAHCEVRSIKIAESVTSINDYAFSCCLNLKDIDIPQNVTFIGEKAFWHCESLEMISIPNGVTHIELDTFADCISLTSISFGEGLESIGQTAFINCINLESIDLPKGLKRIDGAAFAGTGIKSINIPENITTIEDCVFSECINLTTITLPKDLIMIGDDAFSECTSLSSIEIPEYVTSIGKSAFSGCSKLTSIEIPESVTSIGESAFSKCSSLTSIEIPKYVTSIGSESFLECNALESIEIPESVTSIGESAFSKCSSLKSIKIPKYVTSIGSESFLECNALESIEIPESVTSIGESAFSGCGSLTSIEIPKYVTSIGKEAFQNCKKLKSLDFYTKLDSIGESAFYDCDGLETVIFHKGIDNIGDYAFSSCDKLISVDIFESISNIGNAAFNYCIDLESINIPEGLTVIKGSTFKNCSSLTSIKLQEGITRIESNAFGDCVSLQEVMLPQSLENIGNSAFLRCDELKKINIPQNVIEIGVSAFDDCQSLTSIKLPGSVKSIGDYAFSDCNNLESIDLSENIESIGKSAFYGCYKLKSIIISEGLKTIDIETFANCGDIEIILPESVSKIKSKAFYGTYGNIYINNSECEIYDSDTLFSTSMVIHGHCGSTASEYAMKYNRKFIGLEGESHDFGDWIIVEEATKKEDGYKIRTCSICNHEETKIIPSSEATLIAKGSCGDNAKWKLALDGTLTISGTGSFHSWWYDYRSDIKKVIIEDGITGILSGSFSNCLNLTSVEIGKDVTQIGDSAFWGCSSLISVDIPENVTQIEDNTFSRCSSLISVEIPESVTSIGDGAFSECSSLTSIELPKGLMSIDDGVFRECTSLTSIKIPQSVISIGNAAFSRCSSLTSVEIPESVTSIGDGVFSECSSLTSIKIPQSVTSIGNAAFSRCSSLTSIEIPQSVTSIGIEAFNECSSLTSVKIPEGVTNIEDSAFSGCSSLKSVQLPESLTKIGKSAFAYCQQLGDIIIPINVSTIGESAFYQCQNIKNVYIYNYNCVIDDVWSTFESVNTIYGHCGSTANAYAKKYVKNFEVFESSEHSFDNGIITTEPGCETDGQKTYTCETCGGTKVEVEQAIGHSYSDKWTVDIEPDCENAGSKSKHCMNKNCDSSTEVTEIGALGHSYDDGVITLEPLCEIDGERTHTCETCGGTKIEVEQSIGHSYSDKWTVDIEPECEKAGSKSKHCTNKNCNTNSEVTEIGALGHSYDDGVITLEPGCETTGERTYTCETCGGIKIEIKEATGHSFSSEWTLDKETSCKEPGSKSHHCINKGCELKADVTVITKAEHSWDMGVVTTQPTAEKDGVKTYTCTGCGDKKTESIPKLKQYKVTFNANGGSKAPAAVFITEGSKLTIPNNKPVRDGYTFEGWYTAKSGGTKVTNTTEVKSNMTLYARWKQTYTGVEAFVAQLYKVCLGRTPDAVGLADWSNKLTSKQIDGITAAYGFVFSQEFINKNLCNEDYVKQLYSAFLGRKPDAVGLADWVSQMENGTTREDIFNGFALSQEFKGLCEQYGINQGVAIDVSGNGTIPAGKCAICGKTEVVVIDGVSGFVKRLYKVCLNRQADAAGLEDWTGKLKAHKATGRSVAYGFIFSQEFINKNYNNSDYVEHLYLAFMGRGSDPAGKADWIKRMEKDKWTREQVFDGFVGSQEFTGICNSYGITRD